MPLVYPNAPFPQAVRQAKPILYWRGAGPPGTTIKDLSGRGNDSESSSGVATRCPIYVPGDPLPNGWRSDSTGFIRRTTAISGFNSSAGTILAVISLFNFSTGGLIGLFDTASSGVGAMRFYSTNSWTNINYEVGGDGAASFPTTGQAAVDNRPILWGLHWRTTSPKVVVTRQGVLWSNYDNITTPANGTFDWGAVNGGSSPVKYHSIIVFDRFVNLTETKRLVSALYTPVGVA